MSDDIEVFDEWRVTGQPGPVSIRGVVVSTFPSYTFIWSKYQGPESDDPEAAARSFVTRIAEHGDWTDGPHLHRRTVTRTGWEEAD